jgi:hypothetical protein
MTAIWFADQLREGKNLLPKVPRITTKHCFESSPLLRMLFPDRVKQTLCFVYTLTNTVFSRAPQPFGRYCHQISHSFIHLVKRHDRQTSEQQGVLTGLCATGWSNGTQVTSRSEMSPPNIGQPPSYPVGNMGAFRGGRRARLTAHCHVFHALRYVKLHLQSPISTAVVRLNAAH